MLLNTAYLISIAASCVTALAVKSQAKVVTIPLRRHNTAKSAKAIVDAGSQRIAAINGDSQISSGPITNIDVTYVADVVIGGSSYELIVDTGSSNTWCGAGFSCEKSPTGTSTGGRVRVSYGSGSFSGNEYTDTVSFGGLTVSTQSIGAATSSTGFNGVDGILGLGPVDLTQGTVSNANQVPTFMDNLYTQGSIPTEVLGVSFRPESRADYNDVNGELTFGGVDSSKYKGALTYFPRTTVGSPSYYWGLTVSFSYGPTTLASNTQGIIDTGTTLIYIPTPAYNAFLAAAGGTTDAYTGLAKFTNKPTLNFGFTFGSTKYHLTPKQYLIPQAQYADMGLPSGAYYSWISNGGTGAVDCIIGQKFIENFYTVFDTTNSRIGFATGV